MDLRAYLEINAVSSLVCIKTLFLYLILFFYLIFLFYLWTYNVRAVHTNFMLQPLLSQSQLAQSINHQLISIFFSPTTSIFSPSLSSCSLPPFRNHIQVSYKSVHLSQSHLPPPSSLSSFLKFY